MRRSTLETIAILAWLLLLPLAATWLASQGKTSATLLLGVLIVATIAWVMRWARRPWAPLPMAPLYSLPMRDYYGFGGRFSSMRWRVQEAIVLHDAVLEGLESDDDGA